MFRPKPNETFTDDQVDQFAEAALTKSIARPRYGAWAILQLIQRANRDRASGTPVKSDTDDRITKLEFSHAELKKQFDELYREKQTAKPALPPKAAAKKKPAKKTATKSTDESTDGGSSMESL